MAHLKSVLTFPPASAEERALASLASQYLSVRQQTDALTAPLTPEDLMVQSCPEASPAKWHMAHTSWFFETFILSSHLPGYRPFHPQFRDLFNSYYNAVGQQPEKALRNTFSRPRWKKSASIAHTWMSTCSSCCNRDRLPRKRRNL